MNTPFSPIANRHNPKAAYAKIYEWVLRFGSPTILSSSCENRKRPFMAVWRIV